MITFPKVEPVKSGDPIDSKNLTQLARAINARIRSGLGDPTYRLAYYADSLFRQIRNPDSDGYLWPSRSEFLEVYQHVHPSEFTWPLAGPGEPEGVNISAVAGELVFGSEAGDTLPEDERIADVVPLFLGDHPPQNPEERWEMAKQQRGAIDIELGNVAAPAFDAAREHYRIMRSLYSPHGNSYGGFAPTPELIFDDDHPDGTCGGGDSEFAPRPDYDIFFTALKDNVHNAVEYGKGDELHYLGTCPQENGHIAFFYLYPPFAYIVGIWVNNGVDPPTVIADVLPLTDWILGPFSGGNRLTKQAGDHLPRVMNHFSAQFRGTPLQRAEPGAWLKNAFDTQAFFTHQYLLAPARGETQGTDIVPIYPPFEIYGATTYAAGTRLYTVSSDQKSYEVKPGFVVTSVFIKAYRLVGETQVDVLRGTSLVASIKLTTEDPADVAVFVTPIPAGEQIALRIATHTEFETADNTSGFEAELAELFEYKPWPHDHMLLLRLGGCRLEPLNGTDGYGLDEVGSRELGENYFRWGMALNLRDDPGPPGSDAEINSNAVFEAGRQLFRSIRILRRQHLLGYEVADGKSILYFDRWTYGQSSGNAPEYDAIGGVAIHQIAHGDIVADALYVVKATGDPDFNFVNYNGTVYTDGQTFRGVGTENDFSEDGTAHVYLATKYLADSGFHGASGDVLDGVAPSPFEIPSGELIWGRKYIVVGGTSIIYAGVAYDADETFTATKDAVEYTSVGDSKVYEANGIRDLAEPQGFSNQWMIGFQFKVYHTSESSVWKTEAYTDYFSFSERCAFYTHPNPIPPLNDEAKLHFAYGSRFWLAPEVVPGYRFAKGLNNISCDEFDDTCINFYKSCRLYEPDVEIEKTELVWESGQQRVKVTLKGRLHHCDEADATIARDPGTWDVDALRAEPYRTNENAVREYLVNQTLGINCMGGEFNGGPQTGNSAYNSPVWDLPDNPFGACYPSIFLTQLIPEPYQDDNNQQDFHDTPFLYDQMSQAELYIRAMCEGYVDGQTTSRYGCEVGIEAMFDYTFENLCFDAFGKQWFNPIPSATTEFLKAGDVRDESPKGHGPLPNTLASSEIFNQFALAVNKLDKVRVMLPYTFEERSIEGTADISVKGWNPDGSSIRDCESSPGAPGFYWKGMPPDANADGTPSAWADSPTGTNSGIVADFKVLNTTPPTFDCDGTLWIIRSSRVDKDFRFKLVDPDAINAIPETWRDMLDTNGGYLAKYEEQEETQGVVDQLIGADCLGTSNWWNVSIGHSLDFPQVNPVTVSVCTIWSNSGRIHAPPLKSNAIAGGWIPGVSNGPCDRDAGNNATLTPFSNDGILMQIPVV